MSPHPSVRKISSVPLPKSDRPALGSHVAIPGQSILATPAWPIPSSQNIRCTGLHFSARSCDHATLLLAIEHSKLGGGCAHFQELSRAIAHRDLECAFGFVLGACLQCK